MGGVSSGKHQKWNWKWLCILVLTFQSEHMYENCYIFQSSQKFYIRTSTTRKIMDLKLLVLIIVCSIERTSNILDYNGKTKINILRTFTKYTNVLSQFEKKQQQNM